MIAFQVSLNFDPVKEPMKLRDYSEEHTSYNEGFRSTILQSFQFEAGQKKNACLWEPWERNYRSSRAQIFFKIGVLKNFANFSWIHLSWSLKKRLQHRCFDLKFAIHLRTSSFTGHLWWQHLKLNIFMLQPPIYLDWNESHDKKIDIFMLQLMIYYISEWKFSSSANVDIVKTKRDK